MIPWFQASSFQLCETINFYCFKATPFMVLCYGPKKLIYLLTGFPVSTLDYPLPHFNAATGMILLNLWVRSCLSSVQTLQWLHFSFRVKALQRSVSPYKTSSSFMNLVASITLPIIHSTPAKLTYFAAPQTSTQASIKSSHLMFSVTTITESLTQCKFLTACLALSWVWPICALWLIQFFI